MNIIGKPKIEAFCSKNDQARSALDRWFELTEEAEWRHLADIRKTFSHCDKVGSCYVFNVAGNKYRLIANVQFQASLVVVRRILTHAEYDLDKWKIECD
ncbi:MAG: type II toxin-antitoxin system HigB family toxin [Acidobacteriota bacterium]|nr:MAG: type II toxin-antitoxin system HigB family toxin [Acidobacteriota bacterium]